MLEDVDVLEMLPFADLGGVPAKLENPGVGGPGEEFELCEKIDILGIRGVV